VLSQQVVILARKPQITEATAVAQVVTAPPQRQGIWLVFADKQRTGQKLAEQLRLRGDRCILVSIGESYGIIDEDHRRINPAHPPEYQRLMRDVVETGECSLRGVVHLWSVEALPPGKLTEDALEAAQVLNCGSVLNLVQALIGVGGAESPQLWLVTQGVQPIGLESVQLAIAQAPVWGLGRTIALEHPEIWGGLIDLDPNASEDEIGQLLAEIWRPDGEDQMTFRKGQRHVARLVPSSDSGEQSIRLRADGIYLITGGLGDLGLKIARWMVEQGARQLVLVSRRDFPARSSWADLPPDTKAWQQVREIQALEELGTSLQVVQADVSDLTQMSMMLNALQNEHPPLRGIIHAAGVSIPQVVAELDIKTVQAVLRPKVAGTWILHQLTQTMNLDFLVLFSSAASVWGSRGLGHYAAANSFLDIFAHYRHATGLPTLSVNWARWGTAVSELEEFFAQIGLEIIPPEPAFQALEYLLGVNAIQKTVASVDWNVFKPIYEIKRHRPFLEQIQSQPLLPDESPSEKRSELVHKLEKTLPGERYELLVTHIQGVVGQILGFDPVFLDPQQGLFEMGMDSLMAVELKSSLEASLKHALPSTLTFDYPTIEALAEYLGKEVFSFEFSTTSHPEAPRDEAAMVDILDNIEHLSEEEVDRLFNKEMKTGDWNE
ncbi:beta-ketoacyl reductase, partial [Chloroflexota bacterium]